MADRLVAVSDLADRPETIARLPKVGGYYHLNLEAILAAKPDLVLLLDNPEPRREAPRLRSWGIAVEILRAERKDDIAASMRIVGAHLGDEAAGRAAADRFLRRYDAVRTAVAGETPVRVYLAMGEEGLRTAGRRSYLHDLLTDAGGENIAGDVDDGYPTLSWEAILARRPEAILYAGDPDSAALAAAKRRAWNRWPMIPAVRDGRIAVVGGDAMYRPGPRVVEVLAQIAIALHPARRTEIEAALHG